VSEAGCIVSPLTPVQPGRQEFASRSVPGFQSGAPVCGVLPNRIGLIRGAGQGMPISARWRRHGAAANFLATILLRIALLIGRNTEGDAEPWTGATRNARRAY
jgi:hypothetical protein